MVGDDLAAERAEVRRHRVGERLRSAARDRPADGMCGDEQAERIARGRQKLERDETVRGQSGEHRARSLVDEHASREPGRGLHRVSAEARHQQRMAHAERSEQRVHQIVGALDERLGQRAIASRVARAESVAGLGDRAANDDRGAVVERMRERRRRMNELEPMFGERQRAKERRRERERVDRGADVVHEAGLGQGGRPRASADRRRGLVDADGSSGARERDRGGETVRARSDDDRVERHGAGWCAIVTG